MSAHGVIHAGVVGGTVAGPWTAQLRGLVMKALIRPTDWRFDTSGGFEASVGPVGVGAGNFYLKWRDEPTRYKLEYSSVSLSASFSLPVNLSISSAEAPGGGIGKIFYLPGHSDLILKDFPGPFVLMNGWHSYGIGASASLVFLGTSGTLAAAISYATLNPALLIPALAMFKAVGIVAGAIASGPGGSVGGGRGHITAAYAG